MGELDVSRLMSVAEAIGLIDGVALPVRIERMAIGRARGFWLAENVLADRDYPPFDKSLMDGFAVGNEGAEGKIVGEIAAGGWGDRALRPGEAMAIMTGAPVPEGTYGVAPVEKVEVAGEALRILDKVVRGQNIARRGADVGAGEIVLQMGQRLEAAQLAVAASVGQSSLSVYSPPRVAVVSTGDEIVDVGETPGRGQIRNSNSIMLRALLERMGCQVIEAGHVRDDRALIAERLEQAMGTADVVMISGGMSMGKYDFAPEVLRDLGVELLITKVRMKPGKPFLFGRKRRRVIGQQHPSASQESAGNETVSIAARYASRNSATGTSRLLMNDRDAIECDALSAVNTPSLDDVFVFGLPGNPVSAMICTVRLAARLLRRMQGRAAEGRWVEANLLGDLAANGNREFYQPVKWEGAGVRPLVWKGSADIFTLAQADGLVMRPENAAASPAGERVKVMAIHDD